MIIARIPPAISLLVPAAASLPSSVLSSAASEEVEAWAIRSARKTRKEGERGAGVERRVHTCAGKRSAVTARLVQDGRLETESAGDGWRSGFFGF